MGISKGLLCDVLAGLLAENRLLSIVNCQQKLSIVYIYTNLLEQLFCTVFFATESHDVP